MPLNHIEIHVHRSVSIQQPHKKLQVDEWIHLCQSLSEKSTSPAATEAADPPDDPPGTVSRFHGLRVFLKIGVFIGRTHGKLIHI